MAFYHENHGKTRGRLEKRVESKWHETIPPCILNELRLQLTTLSKMSNYVLHVAVCEYNR